MELLRVEDFLTGKERRVAWFLKPVINEDITALCFNDSDESPESNILAIRELELSPNCVIPFHVHYQKEKFYYFLGPYGKLKVTIIINGVTRVFKMKPGAKLIIPKGCPHYVSYFTKFTARCKILVVTSSQDGCDIAWEDDVDELVRNER